MHFQTAFSLAITLLSASHAMASAVPVPRQETELTPPDFNIKIATDSFFACNCPNNCGHRAGSSCRYFSGPSNNSPVLKGKCVDREGGRFCIPQ
ncbi:hypothetical protein B0T14DRAFT_608157 [Immersiella caudata]|uniref:Uncharacterized protein n=1 Tax=Immersiella caudata TaxID=314043 RepID=A0AA39TPB9_9PEZI|nr:hypothetical protein B0T14DRAFT_608157 [Immersiella caudata]